MSQTTSPSIGRKVWYFPSRATAVIHGMRINDPDVPLDASVCYVWHDTMINISVADHVGNLHAITSVTLIAPGEPEPEGRDYCKWMPYQVKQASKDTTDGQVITATLEATSTSGAFQPAEVLPPATPTVNSLEQAIRQAGADQAPRVTMDDIQAAIASEHYFTAAQGVDMNDPEMTDDKMPLPLQLLTICVLVLRNNFTVVGTSACASPANFDAKIGCALARERAIDQVWPLLGYELRSQLHRAESLKQAA